MYHQFFGGLFFEGGARFILLRLSFFLRPGLVFVFLKLFLFEFGPNVPSGWGCTKGYQ